MWSHYANYHKGFCIGFKNNLGINEEQVLPVNYSETRSNDLTVQFIKFQNMSEEEKFRDTRNNLLLTKYSKWAYEKEWRIIGERGIAIYSREHINRIIFGMNMQIEDRNTIRSIFKDANITFYEAIKDKRRFALEIKPSLN